jgi:quinol monooxygenase YgiN
LTAVTLRLDAPARTMEYLLAVNQPTRSPVSISPQDDALAAAATIFDSPGPQAGRRMVQLYVRLTIAPDRVQDTVQALRAVMAPARFHPDCAGVRLTSDVENPTVLVYGEDWLALEPLTREFRSPRFTRLMEVMEASAEPPTLEIRLVSDIRGQEFVEAQWAQ